jgi:hypothetical protein
MFGKLLSSTLKVVTLPIDVAEIVLDVTTGGNGDREGMDEVLPMPSKIRDKAARVLEDIDN